MIPSDIDPDFSSESRYSHAEGEEDNLCHMVDSQEHGVIAEAVSPEWAAKIAGALNERPLDTIAGTLLFFQKAVPNPEEKNFSTQLGCHFEEVREMIQELIGTDETSSTILLEADQALHRLAEHLKQNLHVVSINDRVAYLDAICDQIVTGTGCAHMAGMDIVGAMAEVNSSNLSKFDEYGNPIFDDNQKVMKGPNYRKADLNSFV